MNRIVLPGVLVVTLASALVMGGFAGKLSADDDHGDPGRGFEFSSGTLVLSRSVYVGTASTVAIGQTLPPGCVAGTVTVPNIPTSQGGPGGTSSVKIPAASSSGCTAAVENGEYPNTSDSHNVWNNDGADGSFGVSSPIFLDDLSTDGKVLGTLAVPTSQLVTSFSSKSELALNLALDGRSITFAGYRGGPGCPPIAFVSGTGTQGTASGPVSPTEPNLLDVSNSNTPGVCDPTNPVVSSVSSNPGVPTAYYRAVAEVDARGNFQFTDGNAYSGNNGRAAIKAGWQYYMTGNDNNGGLSKTQLPITVIGKALTTSTGAELVVPGQTAPVPPNINMVGDFEVTSLGLPADKAGKDNNFRGLTIFDNTLYVTKGSGSNGVNTVYQVGTTGVLPRGTTAQLEATPITILPGFPTTLASATPVAFPFGIWFADAHTLYVCDEGDGTLVTPVAPSTNIADAASLATAGLQKWVLVNGTWVMKYVLQNGLNIGVPYTVANYPVALDPATDGCRNLTGRHNFDGTVTLFAITSTVSNNGDTGADPNKLVTVTDRISDMTLPTGDGDHDRDDKLGQFTTLRAAKAGEVLRGITFAPSQPSFDNFNRY